MDSTFYWRLTAGLSFFGWLVVRDLRKPIPSYVRLREYGFLFGTAVLAIGYGLIHDGLTYAISPEYYVIGKALPSAARGFSSDVVALAAQASWSVGLLVGLVFLMANASHPGLRQLPYPMLMKSLTVPWLASMLCACTLASLGFSFATPLSDRIGLRHLGLRSPERFCIAWAIHTGTYLGAIIGTVIAWFRIRSQRLAASSGLNVRPRRGSINTQPGAGCSEHR